MHACINGIISFSSKLSNTEKNLIMDTFGQSQRSSIIVREDTLIFDDLYSDKKGFKEDLIRIAELIKRFDLKVTSYSITDALEENHVDANIEFAV